MHNQVNLIKRLLVNLGNHPVEVAYVLTIASVIMALLVSEVEYEAREDVIITCELGQAVNLIAANHGYADALALR
jgi:hypothetical protein